MAGAQVGPRCSATGNASRRVGPVRYVNVQALRHDQTSTPGYLIAFLPPVSAAACHAWSWLPASCLQPLNPSPVLPSPQGRPYRAVIADTEGAALPARGSLVEDATEAELVLQLAQAAGEAAAGAAAGLSGAPSVASLASSTA